MTFDNRKTLERTTQWIADLPSASFLNLPLTDAQKEEWQKLRDSQRLMSEAWRTQFFSARDTSSLAQIQGKENAPASYYSIEEAVDRREISQHKATLLLLSAKEYKARWELCHQAEKYLRTVHSELQEYNEFFSNLPFLASLWNKFFYKAFAYSYPFESAEALWAETIRADVDGTFSICLLPYYEAPLKKWRQASQFLRDILGETQEDGRYRILKDAEVSKLKHRLVWSKMDFSWLGVMLVVCQDYSSDDPQLRQALNTYNQSLRDVLNQTVTASRKLRGFAWKNGEILYASSKGGVYR